MLAQEEHERSSGYQEHTDPGDFEKKSSFLARVADAITSHAQDQSDILFVSHGRFFNALTEVMGLQPLEQLDNGTPIHCQRLHGSWRLSEINQSSR